VTAAVKKKIVQISISDATSISTCNGINIIYSPEREESKRDRERDRGGNI